MKKREDFWHWMFFSSLFITPALYALVRFAFGSSPLPQGPSFVVEEQYKLTHFFVSLVTWSLPPCLSGYLVGRANYRKWLLGSAMAIHITFSWSAYVWFVVFPDPNPDVTFNCMLYSWLLGMLGFAGGFVHGAIVPWKSSPPNFLYGPIRIARFWVRHFPKDVVKNWRTNMETERYAKRSGHEVLLGDVARRLFAIPFTAKKTEPVRSSALMVIILFFTSIPATAIVYSFAIPFFAIKYRTCNPAQWPKNDIGEKGKIQTTDEI